MSSSWIIAAMQTIRDGTAAPAPTSHEEAISRIFTPSVNVATVPYATREPVLSGGPESRSDYGAFPPSGAPPLVASPLVYGGRQAAPEASASVADAAIIPDSTGLAPVVTTPEQQRQAENRGNLIKVALAALAVWGGLSLAGRKGGRHAH